MYDVNYFIEKFEAIPEKKWYTGMYHNEEQTKFCAAGLCGMGEEGGRSSKTPEYRALANLLSSLTITPHKKSSEYFNSIAPVPMINDGETREYKQKTPKRRILAALYNVREKKQQEANVNAAKEIIEVEKDIPVLMKTIL